jgi:DNA-binding transcriptional ArsR family regulator
VGADFAAIGRLLGNEHRAAMVNLLMEGAPATAGELARAAGVSPSTATEHLAALTRGRLITPTPEGRRKYFTIATQEMAAALEALSLVCPPTPVRSLRQSRDADRLAFLRTCYDHLAGAVAVSLFDALIRKRWLTSPAYDVSPLGERHLIQIGVDVELARHRRRAFARPCLDWTERRPHLAGAVGASLAEAFLANGWARRQPTGRGLVLTETGKEGVANHFQVDVGIS